jgi:ABC-type transport system involved in multi-copper enzyme maturation permease subunit
MIRRLIAKEVLTNLLSLRLTFAFLVVVPLVVASFYVLCNDYAQRKRDYDAKISLHTQAAATDRIRIDRPPSPLMALIGGTMVTTGNTIHLSYYDAPRIKGGFDHTPIYYVFPRTDYVFIIGIMMSLLALLFSYDAISGEREGGTLRLILANSVSRNVVLLGKWIGGYLTAAFPCTIALLLGMLVFLLHPVIQLTATDWWIIILLLVTAWIYLAIFFSLGVFISAISPTTGSAAVRCLFMWFLFVLIIPNAAPNIARQLSPTPSIQEMEWEYDRIVAETAENRNKEHAEASERVSNTQYVEGDELRRIRWRIHLTILDVEHRHLTRQRDRLRQLANAYDDGLQEQMRLGRILASCSPYAVFADVGMTLANTSGSSQIAFSKAVRRYEDNYFGKLYEEKRVIHHFEPVETPPLFRMAIPNLWDRIRQSVPGLGLLVFFGMLCFMAAYMSFIKADVR